tara:strand:- start:1597 stop:1839 length:243 start_codon:yes stop_codon:yes gene_type:complete
MDETTTKQKRVDIVEFVKAWQASESRQQVANKLGVTYGAIASREKNLRKYGVNLKEMAKGRRGIQIDADALNALITECDS